MFGLTTAEAVRRAHTLILATGALLLLPLAAGSTRAGQAVQIGAVSNDDKVTEVAVEQNVAQHDEAATPPKKLGFDPNLLQPLDITPQWAVEQFDVNKLILPTDNESLVGYLKLDYVPPSAELTIEEAVALALKNNHGLNQQRLNALAACQGIKVNWTSLMPQIGMQAKTYWIDSNYRKPASESSSAGRETSGVKATDSMIRSLALSLTQRIYDFGLTRKLIDVSKAQFAIQNYSVDMAEQQLVDDVITAYYNYNMALGQVKIRRDELLLATEFLRQAGIQYEVGAVPRLDVIRAEARLESARDSMVSALSQLGDASAMFFSLLGVEDQRYVPKIIDAGLIELGSEPPAVDESITMAMANRAELQLQYMTLFAGQTKIDLTKNRPILDAYANAQHIHPAVAGGTHNYEYGLELKWNVYTGGKDAAERKQAETELKGLAEGITDLEGKIELDATTSWNRVHAARSSVAAAKKTLELSAEGFRAAAVGYGAGVTPYLDFEDALDKNVAAALGYLMALVEVKLSQANLERAEGFPQGFPGDTRADKPSASVRQLLGVSELAPAAASETPAAAPSATEAPALETAK
jgi:outer membrane protein TolC